VLEREAPKKRGTSGKELDAECARGRRGSDKGKKWGRKHCGKQAGCAGVALRTIAGSEHVHQPSGNSCSCSSIASWNSALQDKKKAVKSTARQAYRNDIPILL
jgi:hypothetical protein